MQDAVPSPKDDAVSVCHISIALPAFQQEIIFCRGYFILWSLLSASRPSVKALSRQKVCQKISVTCATACAFIPDGIPQTKRE